MKILSKLTYSLAIGVLSLGVAEAAYSQQQSAGLVTVTLGDVVLEDIASDINVNVSEIPVTVQVPVAVAANVCDVSVNLLVSDLADDGTAECDAQSTSPALNQIVRRGTTSQQ